MTPFGIKAQPVIHEGYDQKEIVLEWGLGGMGPTTPESVFDWLKERPPLAVALWTGSPISALLQCIDNEVRYAEFVIKLWVTRDVLCCHGRFYDSLKSKTGIEKPIQISR